MEKLLFGNDVQARAYAEANDLILERPIPVNVTGFESAEGAPESFSGECNAYVAIDAEGNDVAYLAYWEQVSFGIRDREAGNVIETGLTFEKARRMLVAFEIIDKKEGNYTEDFYEIYQES